jgi:hypothetical protein
MGAFHLLDFATAWRWLAPYRIHEAEVAVRNRASRAQVLRAVLVQLCHS